MIPTRVKAKLPRNLSYPIGAEALGEELAGAPHAESLSVTFRDEAVWPNSEFRRLLTERLPYRILAAEFRPARGPGLIASNDMLERGWFDESWQLTVYPVLSEFRHVANRLLREEGLPAIVRWLRSSGRAGWSTRSQRIELVFGPADTSLAAQENSGV